MCMIPLWRLSTKLIPVLWLIMITRYCYLKLISKRSHRALPNTAWIPRVGSVRVPRHTAACYLGASRLSWALPLQKAFRWLWMLDFFLSAAACYLFIKYLRKFFLTMTDCYCSSIPLFPTQGSCHLYEIQRNLFIGEIKLVLVEMPFWLMSWCKN